MKLSEVIEKYKPKSATGCPVKYGYSELERKAHQEATDYYNMLRRAERDEFKRSYECARSARQEATR